MEIEVDRVNTEDCALSEKNLSNTKVGRDVFSTDFFLIETVQILH